MKNKIHLSENRILFTILTILLLAILVVIVRYRAEISTINYSDKIAIKVQEYKESEFILNIHKDCSIYENKSAYMFCAKGMLNFSDLYIPTKGITSPERLLIDGGDCETFTVYYNALMELNNISYVNSILDKHVFSIADSVDDYAYCIVDQQFIKCIS